MSISKHNYHKQYMYHHSGMKSITITELYNILGEYINNHPKDVDKMIYFDGLHINGYIGSIGPEQLELM